jgi:hypothetical protein
VSTGRTIGAAIGAVIFVLFFSAIAGRFVVSAADAQTAHAVAAK